jgi:DNA topoisomerase-1
LQRKSNLCENLAITVRMSKNLVIVESPAKAKTIEGYLGADFTVKSSFGHVRDLQKGNNAIDIANNFNPIYEISEDKKHVIHELTRLVKQSDVIWLATDDDREGEAISWHLKEALGLTDAKVKRIVFREITKTAILKAIQNPRTIDYDLVNAQQARRVLDRLVGFELSPLLWKKIKAGLSAGRVQSVAVRIIVEREREIDKFNAVSSYKVEAIFDLEKGKQLKADLPKKIENEKDAKTFLEKCIPANYTIKNLEKKPVKRSPSAPFTTSTLQQQASIKLGFSVTQTMVVAQKLYEAGHITYMRTDSENLSEDAIKAATDTIQTNYGEKYVQNRRFKTKSESAQEAHEAIRPTNFGIQNAGNESSEKRLYDLIWKRAIASQMADAQLEKTIATVAISTTPEELIATGEVIKFDGFLKVYMESKEEDEDDAEQKGMLPPLTIGQNLDLQVMYATEQFSKPSARYTEAALVKKLEELGIGRPSTYAPTITTVQQRGYVVKEDREGKERKIQKMALRNATIEMQTLVEKYGAEKSKLFPTDLARVVNDFLVDNFGNVIDYSFTAQIETQFDKIAEGKMVWTDMIRNFYTDFHLAVEDKKETADRGKATGERKLGIHPQSGKDVLVRVGRYGALAQIGNQDDEQKQFASLRAGQNIETLTLEQALELFKLPREVGQFEEQKMVAAIGKFGPYIKHKDSFVSIPKDLDPLAITVEQAIALIENKRIADANKIIKLFPQNPELKILNGRWGAYIAYGKLNVKIPKNKLETAADLTYEECMALVDETPESKKAVANKKTKAEEIEKDKKESSKTKTVAKTTKTTVAKNTTNKKVATSAKTTAKVPKTIADKKK